MSARFIGRRSFLKGCSGMAAASVLSPSRQSMADVFVASPLADDPNRPQFHLLPAANWMNDPNGPIYWKGRYHMFYQYNPHAAVWGDMHWAHAWSPDMLHWQHLPMALAPTPGGPDEEGCFSGSAVDDNGIATFLYTGVKKAAVADATLRDSNSNLRETQCLATSSDPELKIWKKVAAPVIPSPPPGMAITGFRDPCPWKEADGWYVGIGSGITGQGGCVLLYRSKDLRQWEYLHPLIEGKKNSENAKDPVDSGEMWECPDFFALGDRYVLLYSTSGRSYWASGEYDAKEHLFHPQQHGQLDYGPNAYYAPKSMMDAQGNRVLWGWIRETRPQEEHARAGWAGLMSLPRLLTLNADGELEMQVIPAVDRLRSSQPEHWKTGQQSASWSLQGLNAELALTARPAKGPIQISVGTADKPEVQYQLDPDRGTLSWNGQTVGPALPGAEMRLSLFLDGSVVEVLVNNRIAHTSRVYGLDPRRAMLALKDSAFAIGDAALWKVQPISPDRLTT
jgi:beta-fructofuranosidase